MPELRAATAADLPRIAALARWVWLHSYASEGLSRAYVGYLDEAFDPAALRQTLEREPMWVIEAGEFLQAWAELKGSASDDKLELVRLYVAPPLHGQGLGARLLRHARATCPRHSLWLSAWEGNARALKFYRREGAQLIGETWFELDGQRHRNEVLAWPTLDGSP